MRPCLAILTFALIAAAPAMAQSTNIDVANKHSWGENIGWMNWRDAGEPAGAEGVVVRSGFLSGYIWCENIGWVRVGGAAPANGVAYSNLTGYAWGQNIGWVNFSGGALATPAQPARATDGRLRGYAWGENIGWINLDVATAGQHVGFQLRCNAADVAGLGADLGADGLLTVDDLVVYLQVFFAGNSAVADLVGLGGNGAPPDGAVTVDDLVYFLTRFFSPCD